MKKTKPELDVNLYAAWQENGNAFLTATSGRYRSKARGPGGAEVVLGFGDDDLQKVI